MNIPTSEQWLLYGDCKRCRKDKYCNKACKVHQRMANRLMRQAVKQAIDKVAPEINEVKRVVERMGKE